MITLSNLAKTIVGEPVKVPAKKATTKPAKKMCFYGGRETFPHKETCKWHKAEKDPFCLDCRAAKVVNSRIWGERVMIMRSKSFDTGLDTGHKRRDAVREEQQGMFFG